METRTAIIFLLAIIPVSYTAVIPDNGPVHIHIVGPSASADVDIPNSPDEVVRIKRSGSGSPDFFGYIKRGITGKISQFAQASAGASAQFSKGSSGGGGGGGGYHYPAPDVSYGTKSFDFWTLKKSILNTLLQAVKAINGGIIAVKGQLIKGGGAIISAKGKLISMKGEAIANAGRHIIMNAKLSPSGSWSASKPEVVEYSAPSGHSGPGPATIIHPSPSYGPPPAEYGPPSSPSAPSASAPTAGFPDHPPSTYGAPTAPAYGPPIGPSASAAPSHAYLPQKVTGPYDAYKSKLKLKPDADTHAGIVILKKIPKDVDIPASVLASLPLQDERHKVVKPTVDVTKTPLFEPEPTPYEPQPPSPPTHEHYSHPFFESALKPIPPPKAIYGSPIDAPPSHHSGGDPSSHGGPFSPVLPTAPSFSSVTSPQSTVDESLFHNYKSHGIEQPHFNINKPLEHYKDLIPPPLPDVDIKGEQNFFKNHNNLYLSKIPAPFEINSFGAGHHLPNFGLGALDNVHSVHSALPAPVKSDFSGALDTYAPSFSNLGTDFSSNLQYKDGISEHKGAPHFNIVKSIEYELPIQKRHEKRTEKRH